MTTNTNTSTSTSTSTPAPPAKSVRPPADPARQRAGRSARLRDVRWRLVLLALGGGSLLAGLDAALLALGVWAPVRASHLPDVHGMVMVLGFLGTLIALERAQALRQPWAYLAPGLLGSGGIALAFGLPRLIGQLLLVEGTVLFALVYLALYRRAPQPLVAVQVLSTVPAIAAAALWLVTDVSVLVPLMAAFVVVTIAAERAELAQLGMGPHAVPRLVALAILTVLSAVAALLWPAVGSRLFGAALVAIALWLMRDDVARRLVRTHGFRRYNGAALLAGYGWLTLAGLVWLTAGTPSSQGAYDVVIHATFLGFGLSMVMAHAPTIFPAVLGRPLPYRPVLWLPLGLLHGGLVARVAGDVLGGGPLWQAGSVVTVVALLVFVLTAAVVVVRA